MEYLDEVSLLEIDGKDEPRRRRRWRRGLRVVRDVVAEEGVRTEKIESSVFGLPANMI